MQDAPPSSAVEILDIEEGKLKLVGEELANETGRNILSALSAGPLTETEIAGRVSGSVQLVAYHIKKLVTTGIVRTKGTIKSSRGKDILIYELEYPAVLLIVKREAEKGDQALAAIRRAAFEKYAQRIIRSGVLATVGLSSGFLLSVLFGSSFNQLIPMPWAGAQYASWAWSLLGGAIGTGVGFLYWRASSRRHLKVSLTKATPFPPRPSC